MTKSSGLTDKQLMLLEAFRQSYQESGLSQVLDADLADRLEKLGDYRAGSADRAVPPLLGSLKKLGLVERLATNYSWGHWGLTNKGKAVV